MKITSQNKKRLVIFLFIPIIAAIPFITDNLTLKIISTLLLVIYVGFIIFLRNSLGGNKYKYKERTDDEDDVSSDSEDDTNSESYEETDEGFSIVTPNKNLDVITSDNYSPSSGKKEKGIFKPPDLKEKFVKIAQEEMPTGVGHDQQFAFLLERILYVLKDAFNPHSVVFFWYNPEKQRLTLETAASSSNEIEGRKFELEDDILSKIVQNEEPELLTDISRNAEADVIRYYNTPQGIKSFVGVPLFYGEQLAGILAMDSKAEDEFGIETVYALGRFVRVISIVISLFDERYHEKKSEQRLKSLLGILKNEYSFKSEKDLFDVLEKTVKDLIHWDAFTFVYYNPVEKKFKTSKIINRKNTLKYVGENLEVDLNGTLVGKAIMTGMPVHIYDTSEKEYIRFSTSEDVSFDGAFLAVPLVYNEENYGVLCFESLKKNIYSNEDIKFIRESTKFFAFIVYSYSTQRVLRSMLSLDIETKQLNQEAFLERLSSDLYKAKEAELPGTLVLLKIDEFLEQDSFFEGDPFPKVLNYIVNLINEEMTPLNLVGRMDRRTFGIYFFNTASNEIYVWAEKLRIKIARKPIAVSSKQTTFTVSIGVASTKNKTDVEEVIRNAELALNKALEKGGNAVKSIN